MKLLQQTETFDIPSDVDDVIKNTFTPKEYTDVLNIIKHIQDLSRYVKKQNDFVRIARKSFMNIISGKNRDKYAVLLNKLADKNIIQIDHSYCTAENNKKCKGYKLTDIFKNTTSISSVNIIKKDNKQYIDTLTPDGKYDKQFLYSWKNEQNLFFPSIDAITKRNKTVKLTDAHYWFNAVTNKHMPRCTSSRISSRFYFNSISMPSKIRKRLRYNKNGSAHKLYNYDIKACAPAIMNMIAALLNNVINPSVISSVPGLSSLLFNSSLYVSHFSAKSPSPMNSDYNNNVINNNPVFNYSFYVGRFYDEIAKRINKRKSTAKRWFNIYRNSSEKTNTLSTIRKCLSIHNALKDMGYNHMIEVMEKTNWLLYDEIETIILAYISDLAAEDNLVFIRQHDGWISPKEDGDKILEKFKKTPLADWIGIKDESLST